MDAKPPPSCRTTPGTPRSSGGNERRSELWWALHGDVRTGWCCKGLGLSKLEGCCARVDDKKWWRPAGMECKGRIKCGGGWKCQREFLPSLFVVILIRCASRCTQNLQYRPRIQLKHLHRSTSHIPYHIDRLPLFDSALFRISLRLGIMLVCRAFSCLELASQTLIAWKPTHSRTRRQEGRGKSRAYWTRYAQRLARS